MKKLDIKGFTSLATKMVSDKFGIEDMDILNDLYILQLRTSQHQYRMDIIREASDNTHGGYRYQMWLYDWTHKKSYPMGISTVDLKGVDTFTKYLENVLHIADNIGFDGEDGDWRLRKYNL